LDKNNAPLFSLEGETPGWQRTKRFFAVVMQETVCCTLPSGGQFLVEIQHLEYNEYALKSQGIEAILLI